MIDHVFGQRTFAPMLVNIESYDSAFVKCCVAAVKSYPVLHFSVQLLYFSGPSGSLMSARLSVENWVPLQPVLGDVRDVASIHYPSCTDSIKPSLQFSCNFVMIYASEGSLCFQIFFFFFCPNQVQDYHYLFAKKIFRMYWNAVVCMYTNQTAAILIQ
jgi:hypothetical protein